MRKAIEEILPDCIQISDRFHIHQNLMDAVNKVLGREVPASNAIPVESDIPFSNKENISTSLTEDGKKNRIDCG